MTTKVYEYYNEEYKQLFLDETCKTEAMLTLYKKFLSYAKEIEEDLDKDILRMNDFEFDELLYSFGATSMKSLNTIVTILKSYVQWGYDTKKIKGLIHPVFTLQKKMLKKYLAMVNKFVTKDELFEELLQTADNDQDAVVCALLFDLVKGQATCEIRNLKKTDIDYENQIAKLRNEENDTYREVKLSKETIELIKRANRQNDYTRELKKDIKGSETALTSLTYELADTDYILRGVERKVGRATATKENSPISYQVADTRVKRVVMKAGRPHITTLTIYQSGMMWRLYELEQEKGRLDTEDFIKMWAEAGNEAASYHNLKDMYEINYKPYVQKQRRKRL